MNKSLSFSGKTPIFASSIQLYCQTYEMATLYLAILLRAGRGSKTSTYFFVPF